MMDIQVLERFLAARERLFKIIYANFWNSFGKGYEGVISLTLPSCLDDRQGVEDCIVTLDSSIQFTRNNAWSGSTLSSVVDKMNKDIDLYEANLNRQSHQPDSHGPQ